MQAEKIQDTTINGINKKEEKADPSDEKLLRNYRMRNTLVRRLQEPSCAVTIRRWKQGSVRSRSTGCSSDSSEDIRNGYDAFELIESVFNSERHTGMTMGVMGIAAVSLGMFAVFSCNRDAGSIPSSHHGSVEVGTDDHIGMGLIYLGRHEAADAVISVLGKIQKPLRGHR